jgi:hypothetical protein
LLDAYDNSCSNYHSLPNYYSMPNYHPMPNNNPCAHDGTSQLQELLLPGWVRREAQA